MKTKKTEKELLLKVGALESEIKKLKKNKRFGLVWEDKPEKFEKESVDALPVLVEKGGKFKDVVSKKEEDFNILIEGDNFHSLSVLNYTHRGKIDVIYIDPPYNTGAKNWKYNNNHVDKDDTFRHSKWISMMEKRLRLSKRLLKKDGVLICAIDENEQAHLRILVEELFSSYEIHCISIVHNPRGIQGKNFSYTHEYALFVFPKGEKIIENRKIQKENISWRGLRDNGGESTRNHAKNCFYSIVVKDNKIIKFGEVEKDSAHPKQIEKRGGCQHIYPIDKEGVERKWRYARQSIESVKHLLRVNGGEIQIGKNFGMYRTIWIDKLYDANEYGSKLVNEITGTKFPFPKSLYNVKDCLYSIIKNRKKSLVLDFFAGSGTTGHAVLELNKEDEDKGKRRFILCTNNENKICEEVTYSRIKKVIKGYTNLKKEKIKGLGGNLKYLKTDFIKLDKVNDNLKKKMVDSSTEILCLKENSFDLVSDDYKKIKAKIFQNSHKYTAILFDLFYFDEFVNKLEKLKDKPVSVYVFSYSKDFPKEEFGDLNIDFTVEAIPEKILETYKKIFDF